jgi:hypothetical protein
MAIVIPLKNSQQQIHFSFYYTNLKPFMNNGAVIQNWE